jgi:hypothetical protein
LSATHDFKKDKKNIKAQLEEEETKSRKLIKKLENMNSIEKEMENFNHEDHNISRLKMRLKKNAYLSLTNIYDELIEKGKICKDMLECEIDERYMETYVAYVTFKLQKHIIDKVRNKKQSGNKSRAFRDVKEIIQKWTIKKVVHEGKQSITIQKLKSIIIKVQFDVGVIKKLLRDYEQLQQIISMENDQQIAHD